ncbi:hypothetical protein ACFX13_012580 [Malus domestica]
MVEQIVPLVELALVTAFVVARGCGGRSRGTRRGGFMSNHGGVNLRVSGSRNNNYQRAPGGNGDRFGCGSSRITCQIYGKEGHPALDCYQRMNVAHEGRIPAKRLSAMASSLIILNRQNNGSWLLDTGANAYITPDIQNLVNLK